MYKDSPVSEIVGDLDLHVTAARKAFDCGNYGAATYLVTASKPVFYEFMRRVELAWQSMPSLVKVGEPVRSRLINHLGSSAAAEIWLESPNPLLGGRTPLQHFVEDGDGWFLDATCEWPREDNKRARLEP